MTDSTNGYEAQYNALQYWKSWIKALTNREDEYRSFPPYAVLEILEKIEKGKESKELYKGK